jgi:hypothetical protein
MRKRLSEGGGRRGMVREVVRRVLRAVMWVGMFYLVE